MQDQTHDFGSSILPGGQKLALEDNIGNAIRRVLESALWRTGRKPVQYIPLSRNPEGQSGVSGAQGQGEGEEKKPA